MRKLLPLVLLACALTGCATTINWRIPPGVDETEARQDEYACIQAAQQQQSSAYVDAYGGAAQSGSVTNVTLFKSCMYARGYREGTPP